MTKNTAANRTAPAKSTIEPELPANLTSNSKPVSEPDADAAGQAAHIEPARPAEVNGHTNRAVEAERSPTPALGAPPADRKPPREHTKAERLLTLLRTGTGASLEDMIEATGWQGHTVRAAMTGLRKRGYGVERHTEGTTTVWSIKDAGQ